MDIEGYLRRQLLERIYEKMSDDEKRLFVQMTLQNKSHTEIMQALQQQQSQLSELRKHQQTFGEDFLSNIAGNAAWDGLVWLVSRLSRKLR